MTLVVRRLPPCVPHRYAPDVLLFCLPRSDEWIVFESVKQWLAAQQPAAATAVAGVLLAHVRFPLVSKERRVQLESDELALQHPMLLAKAYREAFEGEDTPRTRRRLHPLQVQDTVLKYFQSYATSEWGCTITDAANAMSAQGVTEGQVRSAVEALVNEGHLYSTIDDEHYKATA